MSERLDLFAGVVPFFHVAREKSFRRAAEQLGVSTAAVSKSVLQLEARLGVKLLARTSRSVALTPEGAVFEGRCRDAILSMHAGHEALEAAHRQPRGEASVTLPYIVGRLVVPSLPPFFVRYPELSVRLSMTDRMVRLAEEGVDVAVRIGPADDSTLVGRRLTDTRWVTVASPAYLAAHGAPAKVAELARFNCLRFVAPNGRVRDWTFRDARTGRTAMHHVAGTLIIDHGDHLLAATEAGLGVAQVLDFMVRDALKDGRLVEVLASSAAEGPPIHALCVPERRRSPNVGAVLAHLQDVFGGAGRGARRR